MSRKELLKKSLGITEYPWSSDEEDTGSTPTVSEAHVLRRQNSEPRTSVADMPGTSGAGQQAPTSPTLSPTRRNQAKMERDLFFSILNNPHKIGTIGIPRSRLSDISSLKYVSPLSWPPAVHTPPTELRERSERPSAAADLQRILPYKKLMRSLNTLRTAKSNSNMYAMSSRGPSRNPLFTPAAATDAGPARTARVHCVLKRLQASRSGVRWDSTRDWVFGPSSSASSSETAAAVRSVLPPTSPQPPQPQWTDEPVVVDETTPSDHGDDVMELPENTDLPQPTGEEFAAPDQEPIDVDTSNSTSGGGGGAGVSLEEEIVEIDPPDDGDGDADVDVNVVGDETDNPVTADVGLNEAAPAPTNDETVIIQPQTQETTRKKRDGNASPDEGEPYTVKEFNQSLLRLLECPVCLEWMEPPMSQCRRGHLVCGRCRARLAACPVCRTTFSSVRNRAMEGVAEMVRYPCRHGCAREVRLRRRAAHEASCAARRYRCPAPACADRAPLPRDLLPHHFQGKHMSILKIGTQHKFSLKVNSEHHDTWLIAALHEYFYMRLDVDIRTWGVIVYVAYIGPKCNAKNFTYQVSVTGQHNSRKLVYCRVTHSDLENSALNVSRQDCFHLTLDQALNFIRFKNRHCEADKFLDFDLEINQIPVEARDDSES